MTDLELAVDKLTKPRMVVTMQPGATDETTIAVTVEHPSLIRLLIDGTGGVARAQSSDRGLPIDADALELWMQLAEWAQTWSSEAQTAFSRDNLPESINDASSRFEALYRAHVVAEDAYVYRTAEVEAWVKRIELKFEPHETIPWPDYCPTCGIRRVVLDGKAGPDETWALMQDIDAKTVSCRACGEQWIGRERIAELKFRINIDRQVRDGEPVHTEALKLLMTRGENRMTAP